MSLFLSDQFQMQVAVYLLALVRVSGIFLIAPFYAGPGVPPQLKAGLVLFLEVAVSPLSMAQGPEAAASLASPASLAVAAVSELGIGFAVGFAGAAVMGAIQTAGYLMSQDIGLTIGISASSATVATGMACRLICGPMSTSILDWFTSARASLVAESGRSSYGFTMSFTVWTTPPIRIPPFLLTWATASSAPSTEGRPEVSSGTPERSARRPIRISGAGGVGAHEPAKDSVKRKMASDPGFRNMGSSKEILPVSLLP